MRLMLHFTRADKADDQYAFRFGREEYQLHGEGRGVGTATLNWNEALLEDLEVLRSPDADPSVVQRVGNKLRRFLGKAGWSRQEAGIEEAVRDGEPVFLTISSNAAELYALPWELLTLEATGQRIGELPGVLIRYAWPKTQSTAEEKGRSEGGRILFVHSDASGAIPAAEHQTAIERACRRGHYSDFFDPGRDVLGSASLDQLAQILETAQKDRQPISVLHILSHGTSRGESGEEVYGLGWYDDRGRQAFVSPHRLRAFLSQDFAKEIRLVVLSACDSANLGAFGNQVGGLAQAVHLAGIPSVIASRFPLSIKGSVRAIETLYDRLLGGPQSLEEAFLAARERLVKEQDNLDWASIQMYARPEDGDDTRPIIFRPYRGLLAFQAEHTRFFFGRGAERAEIKSDLENLVADKKPRFLVVAGASGTGKSSVVMGGALADILGDREDEQPADGNHRSRLERTLSQLEQLHEQTKNPFLLQGIEVLRQGVSTLGSNGGDQWEYTILRLSGEPMAALERALATRIDADRRFLLIIDQFEELFTHTPRAELRQAFCRKLWRLASEDTGIHVVITIRVDFLGACGEIVLDERTGLRLDSVAYDEAHRIFIAKMALDKLRESIERPAQKVGLELQEGLAETILDDVGNEPGALPLVQYTLDLLWQERDGRTLALSAYHNLGSEDMSGVVGALQKKADQVIEQFTDEEKQQARRLLVRLVNIDDDELAQDTRRRVDVATLRPGDPVSAAAFDTVLKTMVGARLLVRGESDGSATVEVAHEALIRKWRRLRDWMAEDRVKLRELKQIERWTAEWKERRTLLHDAALGHALHVQEQYRDDLDPASRQMIAESLAKKQKLERKERFHKRSAFVAAVVMTLVSIVAVTYWQKNKSQNERIDAQRKDLEDKSENLEKTNRELDKTAKEARAALTVAEATAGTDENPTTSARLLRGVDAPDQNLQSMWIQTAVNTLQAPLAQEEKEFRGPGGRPLLAALGHGKTVVARGTEKGTVWIGSPGSDGLKLEPRSGHERIESAVLSLDGQRVLTLDRAGRARVWDVPTGAELWQSPSEIHVTAAALHRHGKMAATATDKQHLQVWQLDGGSGSLKVKFRAVGHERRILSIAFNPEGTQLITGSRDKSARIWHIAGRRQIMMLPGHTDEVTAVAFSPSGRRAVTASRDKSARIWRTDRYGRLAILPHRGQVVATVFRDDYRVITATSAEVYEWSTDGRGKPLVYRGHDSAVRAVFVHSNGGSFDTMVTVDKRGGAHKWALSSTTNGFFTALLGHKDKITGARFTREGSAVTASLDGRACLWQGDRCQPINRGDRAEIFALDVCSSGQWAITASGTDAWLWSIGSGGKSVQLGGAHPNRTHAKLIKDVAFDLDCKRALTASLDGTVRLWTVGGQKHGDQIRMLRAYPRTGFRIADFSPQGTWLLTVSNDGKARIWDPAGKTAIELNDGRDPIRSAAFNPAGDQVVIGSASGAVDRWKLENGRWQAASQLRGHRAAVGSIAFNADASCLVTGSDDETARVWSIDRKCSFVGSNRPFVALDEHRDAVIHALFSKTSDRVFTASADGTVRMWDKNRIAAAGTNPQDAKRWDTSVKVSAGDQPITALAISPEGDRLLVGRADGSARTVSTTITEDSLKNRLGATPNDTSQNRRATAPTQPDQREVASAAVATQADRF
ncbi:MAG: CHAT domain-containing protein [Proteobacteria bacterium]|nr:CHAT domain-containing protein [Pseudomonadota bacterium]